MLESWIQRALDDGLETPSLFERIVYLVWCYPAAINDDGHASFFYNSYGEFALETVQALRTLDSPDYAAILERTIAQFSEGRIPRDIEERNGVFDRISDVRHEAMEDCDRAFFELGDDELLRRLFVYWSAGAA